MDYFRPSSLDEALHLLGRRPLKALAGGTDVFPALQDRQLAEPVLDLTGIESLRGIRKRGDDWEIGALTTWTDIIRAELPPSFDALKLAAREVGSIHIQNRGTIAGNICNASPAADGVPPLLVLDAQVQLASAQGERRVPLQDFITGNRKTLRQPDEIVTAIIIPGKSAAGASSFLKLGARRYLVISIAMVAARLAIDERHHVAGCAIAVGSCSAVAQRLRRVEQMVIGRTLEDIQKRRIAFGEEAFDGLAPINDVRAPASYRTKAAAELVQRAVHAAIAKVAP